jgi:hypothetical protein
MKFSIHSEVSNRWGNVDNPRRVVLALPLLLLSFVTLGYGQAVATQSQRASLGSLDSVGEVYVNETRAPSELTIVTGDTLRTGETGSAVLTTTGRGSFQITAQSEVVFAGDARYFAELKSGNITMKSSGGAALAAVRAANFAIVQTNRDELTVATVSKLVDGSFLVTCSAGNLGIIPMQERPGVFLQAGQSARISPVTDSVGLEKAPEGPVSPSGKSHHLWIFVALAGGGIAVGTAVALAHGSSHPTVSPTSP